MKYIEEVVEFQISTFGPLNAAVTGDMSSELCVLIAAPEAIPQDPVTMPNLSVLLSLGSEVLKRKEKNKRKRKGERGKQREREK